MMTYNLELTDTFGNEANYSWVKRDTLDIPDNASRRMIVRRAKAWAGLTGQRCEVHDSGDIIDIRPNGRCVVLFVTSGG
jgi:hypothetical protein